MKKRISLIIIIIAIALCFCVFPLNLLRTERSISSGDTEPYSTTPNLNPGTVCMQGFIAQEAYLKELSFAFSPIDTLPEDTIVLFELLDSSSNVLLSESYTAQDIIDTNYCTITVDKWLKKGALYSYTLTTSGNSGNNLVLYTTPNPANYASGNVTLALNGVPLEGQAYNLYLYTQPLNKKNILCTWIFIWVIAACILCICDRCFSSYDVNRLKKEI